MKIFELKEALMGAAREHGICAEGYGLMRAMRDTDGLVDYYLKHPDWCLSRGFPDLPTLSANSECCGQKGVYVNKTFDGELLNDLQTYVFHNCTGWVRTGLNVEKCLIPMLYFGNGCRMRIAGSGSGVVPLKESERSVVPLAVFGDNDVTAEDDERVTFKLHHYMVTA